MEFKFQTVHLLMSLIYHSPVQSYLLNFPNDNRSTYGLLQNTDYNFERVDGKAIKGDWKGLVSQDLHLERNIVPEERIIKFQVLDDTPPHSHHRRPNSLQYNYWNDLHRPNRYAPGYEKNQTSTIHSYHPTPLTDKYHWQTLRPVLPGQQYTPSGLTTSSLNFQFGDSAKAGSTTNVNAIEKPKKYSIPKAYSHKIHSVSATEKSTSTRKHSSDPDKWYPPDDYKRKRVRLEIHPGLIVAPIAGFAAYKAVSAFTTNPVLLELGLLKRRLGETTTPESPTRPTEHPHYHHHHHYYSHPVSTTTNRPHHHGHHHGNYHPSTDYPVLLPPDDSDKPDRPWWSPFAAIIPRFRMADIYGMGNERD